MGQRQGACMKSFCNNTLCVLSLAAAGVLAGCGPVRQGGANSFLPPMPPERKFVTPPPPPLESSDTDYGDPDRQGPLPQQTVQRSDRVEAAVREADWQFQLGRRQYQEGDFAGARRAFDRAIDALLSAPETPGVRGAVERKLDELVEAIHRLDLAGLGSADTDEPGYEKSPLEDIPEMTFRVDPKLKSQILEEVKATASQLPLDVTDPVLSYINYFSSERGRKTLLSGLRRAGRYRSLIQRILDEEGVPQELIFLAQAESGFLPRAVSRKRAVGMWQFISARAAQYGLNRTAYVDDRLDFEKATRAAARHLRDLYQRYGDWYLALGAYNAGPGVIDRAVERTGYADFWEFRRLNVLPRETANYVPIIVAMTIMMKNARQHGLEDVETDPPLEYETVEMDAPASLTLIGDLTEAPLSQLRELNPSLLKNVVPAGAVRVPKGAGVKMAALESVPRDKRLYWRAHRVSEGDTLAMIASKYRIAKSSIAAVNGGGASPGDVLLIPLAQRTTSVKTAARRTRTAVKSAAAKRLTTARRQTKRAAIQPKAQTRAAQSKRSVTYSATNAGVATKTVAR